MRHTKPYIAFALIILLQSNCVNNQKKAVNAGDALFKQYEFLLEKSIKFDVTNESFKYLAQTYIDTCTDYNSYYEKRISPFNNYTPIQLKPYLLNNVEDEIILMVLTRTKDLRNSPVDYVHFIFGKHRERKWLFRLKNGYVRSFGYENNHPLLSDTEISLQILRSLIDIGYMHSSELKINDKFFNKTTW